MAETAGDAIPVRLIRLVLRSNGRVTITARGTSMLPAILPETAVDVIAHPFGAVQVGDVVAFALDSRVIVHRVADRTAASLITLGDNLPLYDPPVGYDAYLGVVPGVPPLRPGPRRAPERILADAARSVPNRRHVELPPVELLVAAGGAGDPAGASAAGAPAADPSRLSIGISAAGALPLSALDAVLAEASRYRLGVRILVGFTFGNPDQAPRGASALPPGAAPLHIRLGRPWQEIGTAEALDIIRGSVASSWPGPRDIVSRTIGERKELIGHDRGSSR
jgi:hypothetical protein